MKPVSVPVRTEIGVFIVETPKSLRRIRLDSATRVRTSIVPHDSLRRSGDGEGGALDVSGILAKLSLTMWIYEGDSTFVLIPCN